MKAQCGEKEPCAFETLRGSRDKGERRGGQGVTGWRGGYGQDHRGPCRLVKFGFIQRTTRTHGWHIDQLKGSKIRVCFQENPLVAMWRTGWRKERHVIDFLNMWEGEVIGFGD